MKQNLLDSKLDYLLGEITSGKSTGKLKIKLESGETIEEEEQNCYQANCESQDGLEDISDLLHLNEPSMLYNLKKRYDSDLIHTYAGKSLVVVNPFKDLPIYNEEVMSIYHGKRRKQVPPHIYAVAEEAYQKMMEEKKSQSLIITGETGSGKSENAKKVTQYLSFISSKKRNQEIANLEKKINHALFLIESFSNAKTASNDNSSRANKLIRLKFNEAGVLVGANFQIMLFEKTRVVEQQSQDRNFHIFYQIFHLEKQIKSELFLNDPKDYKFLKEGGCLVADTIDDKKELDLTIEAMDMLGIHKKEQISIWKMIAAIINLGNVEFLYEYGCESCYIKEPETYLFNASELLRVNIKKLIDSIIRPAIRAGNQIVQKTMNVEQSEFSLKSLCKSLYERIFVWVVQKLNKTFEYTSDSSFIGILDVTGFEVKENNSLEQFLTNYTNEKIQQYYDLLTFKLEQENYEIEKIEWEYIDYEMFQQDTIDLMQKSPNSIFSFLNEECIFPRGTAKTLINKFHTLGKYKQYSKVKFKEFNFKMKHYYENVEYNVNGWIEKDKDPLQEDLEVCINSSEDTLTSKLFLDQSLDYRYLYRKIFYEKTSNQKRYRYPQYYTLSKSYIESMDILIETLNETDAHFIRCFLPNNKKTPSLFEKYFIRDRLSCNGILKGSLIFNQGYPQNFTYENFVKRYFFLGDYLESEKDSKKTTEIILKNNDPIIREVIETKEPCYQFGTTKIFFRKGVVDKLEEQRKLKLEKMINSIKFACKSWLAKLVLNKLRKQTHSLYLVQRNVKNWLENRKSQWWIIYQRMKHLLYVEKLETSCKYLRKNYDISSNNEKLMRQNYIETKKDLEDTFLKLKKMETENSKLLLDKNNLNEQLDKFEDELRKAKQNLKIREEENHDMDDQINDMKLKHQKEKIEYEQIIRKLKEELEELKK